MRDNLVATNVYTCMLTNLWQLICACNYTGYFDVSQYELCSVSKVHCSLILNITGCVGCMQLLCSFIVFTCRYMAIHVHSNKLCTMYIRMCTHICWELLSKRID